jgi:hypothetical protein
MLISFSGTTQPYLGVLTENPKRQILGGFALSSDGFVVNDSNKKFQYSNESIVIAEATMPLVMPAEQEVGALTTTFSSIVQANVRRQSYIRYDRPDFIPAFDVGVQPDGSPSGGQLINTVGMYSSGPGGEGKFAARQSFGGGTGGALNNVLTNFYPIEGRLEAGGVPIIGEIGKIRLTPEDARLETGTVVGDLSLVQSPKTLNIWLRQGIGANFTVYTEKIGVYSDAPAKEANGDVFLPPQPTTQRSQIFTEVQIPNN